MSGKEVRASKIGLYFTFFVIELHIFLISLKLWCPAQRLQFRYQRHIYFSVLFCVLSTKFSVSNLSMLKKVYRMSSQDVFSKKGFLLQICFILLEEYPFRSVISVGWTHTSAWMFSCKLAKCRTPFLKNTFGWLLLYMWKWIQQMPAGINLFRVNIEKLEQGVK